MNEFEKLTELFRKFPGVGTRQAGRFAHFIIRQNGDYVSNLANSIQRVKKSARFCSRCQRLAFSTSDEGLCSICSSPNRDHSLLMIVGKDADLDHIERAGVYEGEYFVLGGVLPMRDEEVSKFIRLDALERVLDYYLDSELQEVVLGLSLTPEGEYTNDFLAKKIEVLASERDIKISSLGRGLSVGSELEYSDKDTLRYAFMSRK